MFFSKSYNDKHVIEGALFLKKCEEISNKYISDKEIHNISYEKIEGFGLVNVEKYKKKNIKISGIYYYYLTTLFNGKASHLNSFIKDVYKYHDKHSSKEKLSKKLNDLIEWVKTKEPSFFSGYQEAKEHKQDIMDLIDRHWQEYKEDE